MQMFARARGKERAWLFAEQVSGRADGRQGGVERRRGMVVYEYEGDKVWRVVAREFEKSESRCFISVCEGRRNEQQQVT